MIGLVIQINGKQVGELQVGSYGLVKVDVSRQPKTRWFGGKSEEFTTSLTGMQLDLKQGRRHFLGKEHRLAVGDVVKVRVLESTQVTPVKWTKWEQVDFEEMDKDRARSWCAALGWEIDVGS